MPDITFYIIPSISFLVSLVYLYLGIFAFVKNSNAIEKKKPFESEEFLFYLICAAGFDWSLSYAFIVGTDVSRNNAFWSYFWLKVSAPGFCLITPLILHFTLIISGYSIKRKKAFLFLNYAPYLLFSWAVMSGNSLPYNYFRTPFGNVDDPNVDSPWRNTFVLSYLVWSFGVIAILFVGYLREKTKFLKERNFVLFATGAVTIFPVTAVSVIMPALKINFPAIGPIAMIVWIWGIWLSFTKYKLLNSLRNNAVVLYDKLDQAMVSFQGERFLVSDENGAFVSLLGHDMRRELGLSLYDIFMDTDMLDTVVSSGKSDFKFDAIYFRDAKGRIVCVNCAMSLARYKGEIVYGTCLISDVSLLESMVRERLTELKAAKDEAERRLAITEKYTRKSIVELIERGEDPTAVPSRARDLAVMFADIRDFTALSEKLRSDEIIEVLNSYFELINSCIIGSSGFGEIDKIMGDGIMALFDDPRLAIDSAVAIRERLPGLNERLQAGYGISIENGIGINFGEVVWGNIGSSQKMDLTVIGDVVNSASRIEELTKRYGLPVLITGEVTNRLLAPGPGEPGRDHRIRFIDEVKVKGKTGSARIYEVFDHDRHDVTRLKAANQPALERAFALYRGGEFEAALELYREIEADTLRDAGIRDADPVLAFYVRRCARLIERKARDPAAFSGWAGIYDFSLD